MSTSWIQECLRTTRILFGTFVVICAGCAPSGTHDLQRGTHGCDGVSIDSVRGHVGIRHEKIAGLARARGITGPIDYVRIVSPADPNGINKIRRMMLWWDSHPSSVAACKTGPDITMTPGIECSVSIPGTQLRLDVTFELVGAHDTEKRTDELMRYVSTDVLCTQD